MARKLTDEELISALRAIVENMISRPTIPVVLGFNLREWTRMFNLMQRGLNTNVTEGKQDGHSPRAGG